MVWKMLEAKLSTPRMARYLDHCQGQEDRAAQAYLHNMRIAESLVSLFHVIEVGLRNAIQKEMEFEYRRKDWYETLNAPGNSDLQRSYLKVANAKRELQRRGTKLTADNIVAELSFGFWTSLFNRGAFAQVSKPLMKVFHHCPKNARNQAVIRARLNKARDLRNRCFHHEPLLWMNVCEIHRDTIEIVRWIDPALCDWITEHDRLPASLSVWEQWRGHLGPDR